MLTAEKLNNIAKLKKQHKDKQQSLDSGQYDAKIKRHLDNSQRRAIEQILGAEKYKKLARFHNYEYRNQCDRLIIIDLYGFAIQTDRNALLQNAILQHAPYIGAGLINDFCRDVEATLDDLSDQKIDLIKREKLIKEHDVSDAESAYQSAIQSVVNEINSTRTEQDRMRQLLIQDTIDGNTIGHTCLQGSEHSKSCYINILLKLNSKNLLQVLFRCNYESVSILDLYVKTKNRFLYLASKLDGDDLYSLLSTNNFFINIVHIKHQVMNFLEDYWSLLKEKFESSESGNDQLSQLLNLNCEYLAPANNGWTIGHEIVKHEKINLLLDYIDFLYKLSKDKPLHRFNQPNLQNETFISLVIYRIKLSKFSKGMDTQADKIEITVRLLDKFDFDQKTIRTLVDIQGLKAGVSNYLLNLSPNATNLNLLERIVDKSSSLGLFCWEWRTLKMSLRGLKKSFFSKSDKKDEPTIITNVRARIIEMNQYLNNNKCIPSAPPLIALNIDNMPIESDELTAIVARPISDDEARHLNLAVAVIANSRAESDYTNCQFTLALLGACIAALCFGSYLWLNYSQNQDESIHGYRASP